MTRIRAITRAELAAITASGEQEKRELQLQQNQEREQRAREERDRLAREDTERRKAYERENAKYDTVGVYKRRIRLSD